MRNLKRTLSLVLAMALVVGMMMVGASAASSDFVDGDDITNIEAVDVMVALGVIEGTDTGAFNPTGTLTREQAAAIICRMLLGDAAEDLNTNSTVFTDVAADRWSAGYISYCAQQGILAGTGNGAFDPEGELTGLAFAKMLLVALGYDAAIEQYVGNDWAINVAADAIEAGVSITGQVLANSVNREQAAVMAFQTLEADMVRYANRGTTINNADGSSVIVGASAPERVSHASNSGYLSSGNDAYTQFCERYFSDLKKNVGGSDDFGRPATKWSYKNSSVGTYADEADASYNKNTRLGDIYSDLGLSESTVATVYVDGVESGNVTLSRGSSTRTSYGNGALIEVYHDDDADTVDMVVINTYLAKVSAVKEATSSADRSITLSLMSAAPAGFVNGFETEAFAEDDMVLFTFANGEIQSVELAESVEGEYTAYTGTSSVVVDGTKYDASAKANTVGSAYTGSLKDTVVLYLDNYGYVIGQELSEAGSTNYAYVLDATSDGLFQTDTTFYAKLLMADGTIQTVETTKNYKNNTNGDGVAWDGGTNYDWTNKIVTYITNSNNEYTFTYRATNDTDTNQYFDLTQGRAGINTDATTTTYEFTANSNTIFVVKTGTAGNYSYTSYTGIANVPTIRGAAGKTVTMKSYAKTGSVITFAYIDATTAAVNGASEDIIFIQGSKTASLVNTSDMVPYYELDAVVNGEITTVKVDNATATSNGLVGGSAVSKVFDMANYDEDDVITGLTASSNCHDSATDGTERVTGGTVKIDGTWFTYADDVIVFYINEDGDLVESSVNGIITDANDKTHYVYDDGELTAIFVESIPDAAATYNVAAVTGLQFSTTNATAGFAASQSGVTAGTVVYVKADNGYAVASGNITLSSTNVSGVYSFTMPARATVAADFTVSASLYNVKLTHDGNKFTVTYTSPAEATSKDVTITIMKDGVSVASATDAGKNLTAGTPATSEVAFASNAMSGQIFDLTITVEGGATYTGRVMCG